MSTPVPPKPMPLQPTGALEMGSQLVAIQFAIKAIILSLPKGQRDDVAQRLASFAPEGQTDAYIRLMEDFKQAAR